MTNHHMRNVDFFVIVFIVFIALNIVDRKCNGDSDLARFNTIAADAITQLEVGLLREHQLFCPRDIFVNFIFSIKRLKNLRC